MNYFIKRCDYCFPELENLDPIILLIIDPKIYYIHSSFLREKQISNKKKTLGGFIPFENNEYSLSNKSKIKIFNHKFLLEKWKQKVPDVILKKYIKQKSYQSYMQRKLYNHVIKKASTNYTIE